MKILLQTTIPFADDDWNVSRFSKLHVCLAQAGFDVTSRDKTSDGALAAIDRSGFGQLWLFAVDSGDGLSAAECEAITRFRAAGRGLLVTRDHQDLGSSVCMIGGIGAAHFFHSRNPDPDTSRQRRDDGDDLDIDRPNYHSGANGDHTRIQGTGDPPARMERAAR